MAAKFNKITTQVLGNIQARTMANAKWRGPLVSIRNNVIKPITGNKVTVSSEVKLAAVQLQSVLGKAIRSLPKTPPVRPYRSIIANGDYGLIRPSRRAAIVSQPALGTENINAVYGRELQNSTILVLVESSDQVLAKKIVTDIKQTVESEADADALNIEDLVAANTIDADENEVSVTAVLAKGAQVSFARFGDSEADSFIYNAEADTLEPVTADLTLNVGDIILMLDSTQAPHAHGNIGEWTDFCVANKNLSPAQIARRIQDSTKDVGTNVAVLQEIEIVANEEDVEIGPSSSMQAPQSEQAAESASEPPPRSFRIDKDAEGTDGTTFGSVDMGDDQEAAPDPGQAKTDTFIPTLNSAVISFEQGAEANFTRAAKLQDQQSKMNLAITEKKAEIASERAVVDAAKALASQQPSQQDPRDILLGALLKDRNIVKERQDAIAVMKADLAKLTAQSDNIRQQLEEIGGQLKKIGDDQISFAMDKLNALAKRMIPVLMGIEQALQPEPTATAPAVTPRRVVQIPARSGDTQPPPPSIRTPEPALAPAARPGRRKISKKKVRPKKRTGTQMGVGPAPAAETVDDQAKTTVRTVPVAEDQAATTVFTLEKFTFESFGQVLVSCSADRLADAIPTIAAKIELAVPKLGALLASEIYTLVGSGLTGEALRTKLMETVEDTLDTIMNGGTPLAGAAAAASAEFEKGKEEKAG